MNLDNLFKWITSIVLCFAAAGQLDRLQFWIWQAEAKVVYASRTETWGSPRFKFHEYQPKKSSQRIGGAYQEKQIK